MPRILPPRTHRLRHSLILLLTAAISLNPGADDQPVVLPNGWTTSPAGRQITLGGMPLKVVAMPGGRYVLAMSNGFTEHFLGVIDLDSGEVVQHLAISEGWMGLAVSLNGRTVYA